MAGSSRKIALFGGSFDPVHHGHLILAHDALDAFALDRIYFIPAGCAPLRDEAPSASSEERLNLLRLATSDEERFGVLDLEIRRGGTSYTVDTVRELRREWAGDRLYWIIGADQLRQLDQWHEVSRLAQLCTFLVMSRPGYALEAPDNLPEGLVWYPLPARQLDISSSEIRSRLAQGKTVRHLVPERACARIEELGLYQNLRKDTEQNIAYGSSS